MDELSSIKALARRLLSSRSAPGTDSEADRGRISSRTLTSAVDSRVEEPVDAVIVACDNLLPDPSIWEPSDGYPTSLALCVIDAIWSMGVRYGNVRNILQRYRDLRSGQGADAEQDNLGDLLAVVEGLGGVHEFIRSVGNRQKVSTSPGAKLKGEVVVAAAKSLRDIGIDSMADFLAAEEANGSSVRSVWTTLPGQGSGTSFRYLRILAGLEDVKPDRMVRRFVARALGLGDVAESSVKEDQAVDLVRKTAEHFGVSERTLDGELWKYESSRSSGNASPGPPRL